MRRVIWWSLEEKSYLVVARREELIGGHQKSYLAAVRRVMWRLLEKLYGGRQKSYDGQSKISESCLVCQKPLNVKKNIFVSYSE